LKRAILITLLLTTSATAQDSSRVRDASLVQGFAEGFTFHSHFGAKARIDRDGAVVYAGKGSTNTHIASVRSGAAPCVFLSNSLHLNEGITGTPTVMLEETYDLRGVSFEADPKHQSRPPAGSI